MSNDKTRLEKLQDRLFGPSLRAQSRAGTTGPPPEPGESQLKEFEEAFEPAYGSPPDVDMVEVHDKLFGHDVYDRSTVTEREVEEAAKDRPDLGEVARRLFV